MRARLTAAIAVATTLSLIAAPVAVASPAPAAGVAAGPSNGATPASANGYVFEREWVHTSDVTDDLYGTAASHLDEVFAVGEDRVVRRYDLQGNRKASWELPERTAPHALAVDPRNGELHITIWGSIGYDVPSGVLVYSRTGTFLRAYDTPADYTWSSGITIDTDGTVFLVNTRDDRVYRISATGETLGSFGGPGVGDGQFGQPGDISIGANGTLYVTDIDNERVQQFSKTGTFLAAWGQSGFNDGQFMYPNAIATAPSGNVFVADNFSSRVQEFTPAGRYVRTVGQGYLRDNHALTFDRHGALYVGGYLESLEQGIAKFKPAPPTGKATKVTAKAAKQTYGKRSKVTITVTQKATGKVTVKAGSKSVTGTLKAGKATVRLPKRALKPGNRTITVSYAGVPNKFRPSSTTAKVRVVKAKPSITVKPTKKKAKRGKKLAFRVTVKAAGVTPGGKVTVKAAGAKARTVKLNKNGRANVTLKFAKKAKAGKRTVTVTYRGTKLVKKTVSKKTKITVRR